MSFQKNKINLEKAFHLLQQQSRSTSESWNDPVQKRFYEQFIDSIPQEFNVYLSQLSELEKLFENTEYTIKELY